MTFRDWYTKQFAETLLEPLTESDGISATEIEELLHGRKIPQALHECYHVADDPEVYVGQWEDDEFVWYVCEQTLSRFIIASWLETCSGGDEEDVAD